MRLVTARLCVDALRPADAAALFAYRSDPAVARFQGWRPASLAEVEAFIREQPDPDAGAPGWQQRAIRRREDGALLGDIGVCLPAGADEAVEFGISLAPGHQRQGFAREALQGLLAHGFGALGWRRVIASVDPRNSPSVALLEAMGMRCEAHFRESLWLHGEWVDDQIYALLAREWPGVASRS